MRHHHIEFVQGTSTGITMIYTDHGAISAADAVHQIGTSQATFTAGPRGEAAPHVAALPAEKPAYLFINWDGTRRNNLHDIAITQEPLVHCPQGPRWPVIVKRKLRAIAGATCIALTALGTPPIDTAQPYFFL